MYTLAATVPCQQEWWVVWEAAAPSAGRGEREGHGRTVAHHSQNMGDTKVCVKVF